MQKILILALITIAALIGCAQKPPPPQQLEQGFITRREIIDQCGVVSTHTAQSVTDYIRSRLLTALAARHIPQYPIQVTLVACSEPLAFSLGNGEILFSQGLMRMLTTESELAFVIAHELAHEVLHHQRSISSNDSEFAPSDFSRGMELEADKFGLGLIAYAGYDPRSAINALQHLSSADTHSAATAGHPSTVERLNQLTELIEKSGWTPPGIVNRRVYQQLRVEILTSPSFH